MLTYAAAHERRARGVALLLASRAQRNQLRELISALPSNFEGSLLIAFNGTKSIIEELKTECTTELNSRWASNSLSLSAGQIIWLNPQDSYEINRREQLLKTGPANKDSVLMLVRSLTKEFGHLSAIVPFDTSVPDRISALCQVIAASSGHILLPEEDANFSTKSEAIQQRLSPAEIAQTLQQRMNSTPRQVNSSHIINRDLFEQILALLHRHKGTDFSEYREATLITRLQQRLANTNEPDLANYWERLQAEPAELDALYSELLIGTTSFFREPEVYEQLYQALFNYLKTGSSSLKIWSAGCSTGEEVYSLALVIDRVAQELGWPIDAEIVATDLNKQALRLATTGLYTSRSIETIPPEYLPRQLKKEGDLYNLRASVTASIGFKAEDLLHASYKPELDLIVCRNLLIYFKTEIQDRLIESFHSMLKPNGLLVLGRSESTGTSRTLFVSVDQSSRVYKALSFKPLSAR